MLLRTLLFTTLLLTPVWAQPTPLEQDKYRFPSRIFDHCAVVSAERKSSEAGMEILKNGGNAVDAAVVTAFMEAVTLPRAGNLGGGGFMLIRNPQGQVFALDFRERAPERSTPTMYLDENGAHLVEKSTVGGLAVGVPGTVAGLDEALKRFGTISLKQAIEPARQVAEEGFVVPRWLTDEVERVREMLTRFPSSKAIFFPGGKALPMGSVWKQPDLAGVLKTIQDKGVDGFYRGPVARKLVDSIQQYGGIMSLEDLASYKALWRTPVTGTYREYQIFSMPPPSSGGIHVIQALNVLEGYDIAAAGPNSALNLHRLTETLRQCYADRSEWLGDPEYFHVPTAWLISKTYARTIREKIPETRSRRSSDVKPGQPLGYESPQTTHLVTMDENGWAVSLTYTLNYSYGSGLVAEGTGILLNNEMEDFAAAPNQPNAFGLLGGKANEVQAGKRPLSSMAPTIVQRNGQLVASLGSPGGSRIITVVIQVLMNLIDFDENAQTAVAEPRMHHQWYPDQLEVEQGFSPDTLDLLRAWGHNVKRVDSLGHAMVIRRRPDGKFEVGADPRRTGGYAAGF